MTNQGRVLSTCPSCRTIFGWDLAAPEGLADIFRALHDMLSAAERQIREIELDRDYWKAMAKPVD